MREKNCTEWFLSELVRETSASVIIDNIIKLQMNINGHLYFEKSRRSGKDRIIDKSHIFNVNYLGNSYEDYLKMPYSVYRRYIYAREIKEKSLLKPPK